MLDYEGLKAAMGELDEDIVMELLKGMMEAGGGEAGKAMDACSEGMNTVGELFQKGEYFVGDLIYAGELMQQAVELLSPALMGESEQADCGKMIMCTVEGDLHDIGKNICISMLRASGFDVLDLGIDVPADTIVEEARKNNVKIVALSGVLTLAVTSMQKTVEAFRAAGLNDVKIIIGGAPVTEEACRQTGADEWCSNPQKTVEICKGWL